MTLPEVWTREELSAHAPSSAPVDGGKRASIVKGDPLLWGRPGHLTSEECDIYVSYPPHAQKES